MKYAKDDHEIYNNILINIALKKFSFLCKIEQNVKSYNNNVSAFQLKMLHYINVFCKINGECAKHFLMNLSYLVRTAEFGGHSHVRFSQK